MTHYVLAVASGDKAAVVRELAGGMNRSLLFLRTKHQAKRLAKQLTAAGIPAVDLHGNLSQNARERHLAAFADGSVRVMVATDIAARGIHVDDVNLVVHVDPPTEHKEYTQRSGRTARAGAQGVVVPGVRRRHVDDVDLGVGHELGVRGVPASDAVLVTEAVGGRLRPRPDRGHDRVVQPPQVGGELRGDPPGADDAEADGTVGRGDHGRSLERP
jgi:hypothetical protein